jgi:hypothetical protein
MQNHITIQAPVIQLRPEHLLERWFYTAMAVLLIVISVAGFAPAMLNPASRREPLSALAAVHGLLFFAWLGLFLIQAWLAANGRISLHRRLGITSILLLLLMVPSGFFTTIAMVRRGFDLSGDQKLGPGLLDVRTGSVFNFLDLLAFTVLAACALFFRRRPTIHKRLMLFANIQLMGAPLAHLLGHAGLLTGPAVVLSLVGVCLAAVAGDYVVEKRLHPLTLTLAIVSVAWLPIAGTVIGPSSAWHHFVDRLADRI